MRMLKINFDVMKLLAILLLLVDISYRQGNLAQNAKNTSNNSFSSSDLSLTLGTDYNSKKRTSNNGLSSRDLSLTLGTDDYNSNSTRTCGSTDVRNKVSNLEALRGCRVVEGFVQIVLIDHANDTDYDQFSFPELLEITHYLLFYRVSGLRSVSQLFPSLSVIRGNVVFQDYALIIYEMFHLQDVGLRSLTEITRGAVRIEKNPSLCFLNTINWDLIARWDAVKNYISNNKNPVDCPGPSVCQEAQCPLQLCWNSNDCQIQPGELYKDCHPQCMGGCSGPGPMACHSCQKYLTADGECVNSCPNNTYIHLNHRCVTKDHCLSLIDHQLDSKGTKFVVFNGTCIQNCPPGYDFTKDRKGCEKCEGKCRKVCPGLSITNVAAAQTLRGCTYINGSLEIAIKHGKHKILAQELEEGLKSVEQIKGYLKVIRSFPLVNLKFFKSLEVIHGEEALLENGKYSLIVLDNQNLQELWDLNINGTKFNISHGRIFFHYNPKLCYYYIENLINMTNLTDVNTFEVARDSNGDKFSCNITQVNLTFPRITDTAVVIEIVLPSKMRPVLQRYVLYYTEARSRNMTVFEETDECDDDSWKVRDVLVDSDIQQVSTMQPSLKPFTQYAFYVKTYTNHSVGGQSSIYYIKTRPSRPSKVSLILFYSNHSSMIVLQWEPPKRPNGVLSEYIIEGFWLLDERTVLDQRDYCHHPLMEDTADLSTPTILTNIENETKTCCPENKITFKPRGKYGTFCENPGQQVLPFESDDDDFFVNCNKFNYSYDINHYSSIFKIRRDPIPSLKNDTIKKLGPAHSFKLSDKSYVYANSKKSNERKSKDENTFFIKVKSNTTSLTIRNLHHFAKYTILISACRERDETENYSDKNRCSKPEMLTVRTLRKLEADDIKNNQVNHEIIEEEGTEVLQINWIEPNDPNGAVLAFEIEYIRTDLENAKSIVECITYLDYIKNGRVFSLKQLHPGTYNYTLRAISLAGAGRFTNMFHFKIAKVSSKFKYLLTILILTCLMVLIFGGIFYFFNKRQRNLFDLDRLLASINNEQMTSPPSLDDSWEISREQVHLIRELGKGTFGQVYEGFLRSVNIPCAVKVVTDSTVAHSSVFHNEVSVMKRAAGVHHIVQLLGVVSSEPPLIVMELLALGDLKTYLRSLRDSPPSESTVLQMAAQIADAMFFLEYNKLVHRDLAARNCLVHKDLTVKVGDFGLTRDVYLTDYYRRGDGGLLPVRWMAPESLRDGVFTSHSDAWSYGVVLWEIATLAELPYRGLTNEQVKHHVVSGKHLPTPLFCPEPLKNIMIMCWKKESFARPSFYTLVSQLETYTDDVFKCVSYYHIRRHSDSNYCEPQVTLYF